MILDESLEHIRGIISILDKHDSNLYTGQTRSLGLIIIRGSLIQTIANEDGYEEIENPYL